MDLSNRSHRHQPRRETTQQKENKDMSEAGQVVIDLNALQGIGSEISEIDTAIAAATGSETAVRKGITSGFATENAATIDGILEKLIPNLAALDTPVLAGIMDRLPDVLDEEFKPRVDELVDGLVEKATAGAKGNLVALREQRKGKIEAFKALKAILEQFQIDTSSVPDPKRGGGRPAGSGGGSAKSGRNKEGYRYVMDGQKRPPSQNTMSSLAYYATMGCAGTEEKPERWGTKQLKDFLAEQGVKLGAPSEDGSTDDTWEATLPNGKVISAYRYTQENDPELFADEADSTDDAPAEAPTADAEVHTEA
jgi:hypothetical protein